MAATSTSRATSPSRSRSSSRGAALRVLRCGIRDAGRRSAVLQPASRAPALPLAPFFSFPLFAVYAFLQTMCAVLVDFFAQHRDVCVAFLFGSRARGSEGSGDWDLAVIFEAPHSERLKGLARIERLRSELAKALSCRADRIDLVDLRRAPLNLCITVAQEGQVLKGASSLELFRFYQRAWRGQEEFHFRKAHGY